MKLASFQAIEKALNASDVRHLIVGGLAVAAHGYGRMTFDIDIVLQLQPDNVARAIAALEKLGFRPMVPVAASAFADPEVRMSWIRDKHMVVFQLRSDQHPETTIDLFISEPFDFDAEYERAMIGEIGNDAIARFVGIDALIGMKKSAGREKDLADIKQLEKLRAAHGPE